MHPAGMFLFIFTAGIMDGLNPCALSVLVFFFLLLVRQNRTPRDIYFLGVSFAVGTFIIYFGAGLGLFYLFNYIRTARIVGNIFYPTVITASFIMAAVSAYDAWVCRKNPAGALLQLPRTLKTKVHMVTEKLISRRGTALVALLLGATVTFLEFLCTGQIYLGVLAMLDTLPNLRILLLFIFNLGFIVPVLAVTLLVAKTSETKWLSNTLFGRAWAIKVANSLLYLSLGVFMIYQTQAGVFQ